MPVPLDLQQRWNTLYTSGQIAINPHLESWLLEPLNRNRTSNAKHESALKEAGMTFENVVKQHFIWTWMISKK
jgi:enamine deaminase RidA (YjgF/YER057c/UK114 family)